MAGTLSWTMGINMSGFRSDAEGDAANTWSDHWCYGNETLVRDMIRHAQPCVVDDFGNIKYNFVILNTHVRDYPNGKALGLVQILGQFAKDDIKHDATDLVDTAFMKLLSC